MSINGQPDSLDPHEQLSALAAELAEVKAANARMGTLLDSLNERLLVTAIALARVQAPAGPPAPVEAPESAGDTPFITVAEAAAFLRCSKQHVYDLRSTGRLTRHGRLCSRAEVEELVAPRRFRS